ncbi:MAG TPA: class I SAM-dependent methyltransferase, partial [Candidatus Thermoplasmatota archaeon]|nr:class I SAM-dependent methyltransferase [Candidatus Thermoplasmatota archaeon]
GMRVLDAGSGPGRLAVPVARAVAPGGEVVALDAQEEMLRRLRERARGLPVRARRARLGVDGIDEGGFDRALLAAVLGEVPERVGALREVRRALSPRGLVVLAETALDPHYVPWRASVALAAEAGLRPVATTCHAAGHVTTLSPA